MADRPIIFSAPMVRALLDGRKTQTRRLLNPQPVPCLLWGDPPDGTYPSKKGWSRFPYAPGDRLYVRETFCPRFGYPAPIATPHYRADNDRPEWRGLWKPSIHMPRWASRLTLTVTDVRVQRLQDISEADAKAEGVLWVPGHGDIAPAELHEGYSNYLNCRQGFEVLWNSLHGPAAWDANPWVVALTFDVQRGNIDHMKEPTQ